jgi:surfactin synthase thioesterase subunit
MGEGGARVPAFDLDDDAAAREDELEGWRVQTASRFRLQMFAGKHFFFNGPARQPFFASLADELSQLLASLG